MDGGCTTHLSVVDKDGNMVSVTQTLTLIFGSAVTIPGVGVMMNDSMNLFEPIPGRANSIAPWKRPASNMAHVIAVKDGTPVLAVGAPGGRRIIDTCLQMTLDVLDFDLDIQSACAAPLIDCSGPELLADDRIPAATRARLRARNEPCRCSLEGGARSEHGRRSNDGAMRPRSRRVGRSGVVARSASPGSMR